MARRYSQAASKDVKRAMHKRKRGALKSGGSGKTVKSRKQAIAIGLSEARKKGKKVPKRKSRAILTLCRSSTATAPRRTSSLHPNSTSPKTSSRSR
jgi:hypothetical protein